MMEKLRKTCFLDKDEVEKNSTALSLKRLIFFFTAFVYFNL